MQIPVRIGLVGSGGRALALTLEGENRQGPEERVLELTEREQRFTFVDVDEQPLISIGRRFSAPAYFKTALSRNERAALMASDSDAFNRWEAGQALATEVLLELAQQAQAGNAPPTASTYLDALREVFAGAEADPAFAALMLTPPLESELAQAAPAPVNPDAIHAARVALVREIAQAHGASIHALYASLDAHGPFSPDAASAGRRNLRNVCLRYLTAADDFAAAEIADAHYRAADNMTDMIAGLAALSRMNSPLRDAAFAHFFDRFRNDQLVVDKWMSLQAGSPLPGTVIGVRALMHHPAFDVKNPNRVRALLGAFSVNHLRFHAADGEGYRLIGETIRTLDPINPQIAARMAAAFENWRRYDGSRQALMRKELDRILAVPGLSTNLFEVATKIAG